MVNKFDIELGRRNYIKWVDVDTINHKPFSIDLIINPILPFLTYLETKCDPGCCGLDAYDFKSSAVKYAVKHFENKKIINEFESVFNKVEQLEEPVFISNKMNSYFAKNVFLELLNHIIKVIKIDEQATHF